MSDILDPALKSDRAFGERARLWVVAKAKINQRKPASDDPCSNCLHVFALGTKQLWHGIAG